MNRTNNNRNNSTHGIKPPRPKAKRPGESSGSAPKRYDRNHPKPTRQLKAVVEPGFQIIERVMEGEAGRETGKQGGRNNSSQFRVLIAVHRPRYRGRTERAAALVGWEITALLNKQDPVGLCAKPPRPPDVLILSGDFGRQKDLAIFRAVQPYRRKGMRLVGLIDDCPHRARRLPRLHSFRTLRHLPGTAVQSRRPARPAIGTVYRNARRTRPAPDCQSERAGRRRGRPLN